MITSRMLIISMGIEKRPGNLGNCSSFWKTRISGTQPLIALTIRSLLISAILILVITASGQWCNVSGVTAKEIVLIGLEGICAALLGQFAYYYAPKLGTCCSAINSEEIE
jgi:uncharacterized membrane protein